MTRSFRGVNQRQKTLVARVAKCLKFFRLREGDGQYVREPAITGLHSANYLNVMRERVPRVWVFDGVFGRFDVPGHVLGKNCRYKVVTGREPPAESRLPDPGFSGHGRHRDIQPLGGIQTSCGLQDAAAISLGVCPKITLGRLYSEICRHRSILASGTGGPLGATVRHVGHAFHLSCGRVALTRPGRKDSILSTIAIVGAGPGLGLAIARAFGRQGFDVALVARNKDRLDGFVADLAEKSIRAAVFPADVMDRTSVKRALGEAVAHFGAIDVLEYSPVGTAKDSRLTAPSQAQPEDIQQQIDFQLYGAMAATEAVLPAMREAGSGTLLYTTGAGSVDPVPFVGNVNAAAAALRNWVINLNKELAGTGVYPAHVAIDVSIGGVVPDFRAATADQVAAAYWELYQTRDVAEKIFTV